MFVKKIMTKDVGGVIPESTLKEAAHKMLSLGVGFLPVCDGERLVGVITDRDIAIRSTARGKNPQTSLVKNFMSPKVFWIFEDEGINKAAEIMEKNKIRRLVVLNKDKQLSGVISLGDLAVYVEDKTACEILKEVSHPAQPKRGV